MTIVREPDQEPQEPQVEKFVCPTCGRSFDSRQALGGHSTSHLPRKTKPPKVKRPVGRPPKHPKPPPPPLSADDVIESVLEIMFPLGEIPLRHFKAIIEWCQQTKTFIEALKD